MQPGSGTRRWAAGAMLCVITLLAYSNSFHAGFVLDNSRIVRQEQLHQLTWANLELIVSHTYWWPYFERGLYRPITSFLWLINYAVLDNTTHPEGYHWVNLLLQAVNVVLVFRLALRLVGDTQKAFLMAALWTVHPVLTESVTNLVGRADLLASMAIIGGLLIYLRSTETRGRERAGWLASLAAVTALGVFSKENAVVLPAVLVLYEITWWKRERLSVLVCGCVATMPGLFALAWARSKVVQSQWEAWTEFVDNPIAKAGWLQGRLTALKVIALNMERLVWPMHLSADYSYAQVQLADGRATDWIAWAAVAAAMIGMLLAYRRHKLVFFAGGVAFITLLPTSNLLIPVGTIMGERFLYLAAAGMAIALTLALYWIGERVHAGRQAPLVAGLIIAALFGVRTWMRNRDWHDDFTFWTAEVQNSPKSFKTHFGLATELMKPEHSDPERALAEDEKALAILGELPDGLNNPGTYLQVSAHYTQTAHDQLETAAGRARYERAKVLLLKARAIFLAQPGLEEEPLYEGSVAMRDRTLMGSFGEVISDVSLSGVEQVLGNAGESMRWAEEGYRAGPARPIVYFQLEAALELSGHPEEGRQALMEGLLLTSHEVLEKKLVRAYANTEAKGEMPCAISYREATPRLNFACETVRADACSVYRKVMQVASGARSRETAERLQKEITERTGCR